MTGRGNPELFTVRLPFIMGAAAALLVGMIGYRQNNTLSQVSMKMLLAMFIFYLLGTYIRYNIENILREIHKKKEQEAAEKASVTAVADNRKETKPDTDGKSAGNTVDYRVDGEDFSPLKVSDIIKTKDKI